MGTRFVAERAEPEHGTEHRKMPFVQLFSVQWNTSKFSEHMDGYCEDGVSDWFSDE